MKAFAKINLYLKVINKRDDGYHNLQMVNTKINICDIIYISKSKDIDKIIYINDQISDISNNNLILKVLKEFKTKYNITTNYIIKIKKKIPYGAGLGGVSMDVGKVIEYINKKEKLYLSKNQLIEFSKKYGADIPYSLYDSPSIVEGIGEKITKIKLDSKKFILIHPDIYISTKDIFANHHIYNKEKTHLQILDDIYNRNYTNDLQLTTININKELKELNNYIQQFGQSFMTGSGSCFILDTKLNMKKVIKKIKQHYPLYKVQIIKTKKGK